MLMWTVLLDGSSSIVPHLTQTSCVVSLRVPHLRQVIVAISTFSAPYKLMAIYNTPSTAGGYSG
jgi:hypothetical protein